MKHTTDTGLLDRTALTARLRALPALPLPDGWPAVQRKLRAREARYRVQARAATLAMAASILALVVLFAWRVGERSSTATGVATAARDSALLDLRDRSRHLEAVLAALPERPAVARSDDYLPIDELEAHVQWLDQTLNMRLAADATDPDAPEYTRRLWRERVDTLDSLVTLRYVEAQHRYR